MESTSIFAFVCFQSKALGERPLIGLRYKARHVINCDLRSCFEQVLILEVTELTLSP